MEKLLVLKDLYSDEEDAAGIIERERLRSAAIAWIKELKKCSLENSSCNHNNDFHHYFGDIKNGDALSQPETVAVKDFIKHFFGIDEGEFQ